MKLATKMCFLAFMALLLFPLLTLRGQNQTIERIGDVLLFVIPATALGSTFVVGDTEGSVQFSKSFLFNQAMTIGLKEIINKPRPYNNGNNAFPSGHTSTAFQGASFIQRRYGLKFGLPAYALAGFTGFSRINANRHDAWDVLAGAIVGIGSTYLFTSPYQQEHMEITFSHLESGYAMGFKFKF